MNQQISKIFKKTFSDTVQLSGHKSEIYTGKFSKDGELYATAGNDKEINMRFCVKCHELRIMINSAFCNDVLLFCFVLFLSRQ